jgi:type I restriction enzyme S subunit
VAPDVVHGLKVPVPTSDELAEFDARIAPLFRRVSANRRQSRTLAALRDALLPRLVSGEIRVPEAEDAVQEVI